MIRNHTDAFRRHKAYCVFAVLFAVCIAVAAFFINTLAQGIDIQNLNILIGISAALFIIDTTIYYSHGKRWLVFCYIALFAFLFPTLIYLKRISHLIKASCPFHFLQTHFLAFFDNNADSSPFTTALTSITSLFVFERILEWMPNIKCNEWNPFTIAELRIHKFPALLLTNVYFLYLIRIFLGYKSYELFFEMIVIFTIIFVVFWIKFPYPKQGKLLRKVVIYIKCRAHLPKSIKWMYSKSYALGKDAETVELITDVCIPLLHTFSRFRPVSLARANLLNIVNIIEQILKPYSDKKIEKATEKYLRKRYQANIRKDTKLYKHYEAKHVKVVSSISFSIGLGLSKLDFEYVRVLWALITSSTNITRLHQNSIKIGVIVGLVIDCQREQNRRKRKKTFGALNAEINELMGGSITENDQLILERMQRIIVAFQNGNIAAVQENSGRGDALPVLDRLYSERRIM